ncbi:MAG: PaaI family thioesterase [Acidimicrobiales bacterium]|nr:PaaI family thioesterase [Acidimicrobiales bacterium]MCB1017288.1 PaaI family thioesterase [Acidimicrobiales bacterium]MCB9372168.1 PaaI family thioesterase [Microthrixaceae bacterium]
MSPASDANPYGFSDEEVAALEARFSSTPLHHLLGLEFEAREEERVVVAMPVREEAFGSTGNLHGGAIATLCDVASASVAARASSFVPGQNTLVTADLHVRYLGRPKGDVVRAEAQLVRAGRQLVVVECRVLDREDRVIAVADFAGMVVPLRQPLLPGAEPDRGAPEL